MFRVKVVVKIFREAEHQVFVSIMGFWITVVIVVKIDRVLVEINDVVDLHTNDVVLEKLVIGFEVQPP